MPSSYWRRRRPCTKACPAMIVCAVQPVRNAHRSKSLFQLTVVWFNPVVGSRSRGGTPTGARSADPANRRMLIATTVFFSRTIQPSTDWCSDRKAGLSVHEPH